MENLSRKSIRRMTQLYYMCWTVLATASVFYLSYYLVTQNPTRETLTKWNRAGETSLTFEQAENETIDSRLRTNQRLEGRPGPIISTSQNRAVAREVAAMRQQITKLQDRIGEMEKSGTTIKRKINRLEQEFTFTTASLKPKKQSDAIEISGDIVNGDVVLLPAQSSKNIPRYTKRSKINTRQKPLPSDGFADDITEVPPIVLKAPTALSQTLFAVYLGSGRSLTELRTHWQSLQKNHAKHFTGLEGHYTHKPDSSHGLPFRLIAGPFKNAARAIKICSDLRVKAVGCRQTKFAGNPL